MLGRGVVLTCKIQVSLRCTKKHSGTAGQNCASAGSEALLPSNWCFQEMTDFFFFGCNK